MPASSKKEAVKKVVANEEPSEVVAAFRNIVRGLPAATRRLAVEQIKVVQRAIGDDSTLDVVARPKRY